MLIMNFMCRHHELFNSSLMTHIRFFESLLNHLNDENVLVGNAYQKKFFIRHLKANFLVDFISIINSSDL